MKTLVLYLGKKYVLSAVNDLLQKYGNNVPKITGRLSLWIERLQRIVAQLQKILERVADGQIDSEEVETSVAEIRVLVKEF